MENTMENTIKIRKLLKSDQKRISGMLLKMVDKIDDKSILHIISNSSVSSGSADGAPELTDDQRKTNIIRVFVELLKKLLASLNDDVTAFFADLIGVTPEEYDQLPIDIDIQIIEQIVTAPEVENFFSGALRIYNGTQWFKSTLGGLKDKFDSVTGSLQRNSAA